MENSRNNALLDDLIEIAKSIENTSGTGITAESFILAVIKVLDGTHSLKNNDSSQIALRNFVNSTNINLGETKTALENHIIQGTSKGGDEIYFKIITNFAGKKAAAQNGGVLTPEFLLKCILDEPSIRIKSLLVYGAKPFDVSEPQEPQPTTPVAPNVTRPVYTKTLSANPDKVKEVTERVKQLGATLSETVFGQEKAISVLTSGYFQGELSSLTNPKRTRPHSTFLFAGPPGVGKTFLAESFASLLGLPFKRFDMSEYCEDEAILEFSGSDKVYKHGKEGNFTSFVQKNPKCVVLFDEIEKAHITIIYQFLQMLDAGRARDNYHDIELSLKDVIMIFTTNAGKQLYEDVENGNFSDISRKVILDALQKDVNPVTSQPFFPGAICSRFASGNVVMFNHVSANNLLDIAKKEIGKHTKNFENTFGIKTEIDESVYTALLLAEGGNVDARVIRSRSESFFSQEVFELFRLAGEAGSAVGKIVIDVVLPENNEEIVSLFESSEKPNILIFAAPDTVREYALSGIKANVILVSEIEEAIKTLHKEEINFAILDFSYGLNADTKYLNIEDVYSKSKELFEYISAHCGDIPVHLLKTGARKYTEEEIVSILSSGVRGTIDLCSADFVKSINMICIGAHRQKSLLKLAKANKLVTYETAQWISEESGIAHICLVDLRLVTAINSSDSQNVMNGISKPNVRYSDVIGSEDAIKELKYFSQFLKDPQKSKKLGAKMPKGILLYGPPGTGKTMLAKAMAGENNITFIATDGNSFLKRYVGEGAEKVHEIFKTARKYAPSIIFVDEIDSIAKERMGNTGDYDASDVLTAFLTEMDGFKQDPSRPVFVLAATNFEVEPGSPKSLDQALLRRFDRRIYVDLPNRNERVAYMKLLISKNKTFAVSEEMISNLAVRSAGMSPAQLESVFEMALRNSIMSDKDTVTDEILENAFETFRSGESKQWDSAYLRRTAIHESGHALICALGGEIPSYLTIVARSNHGGYMQHGDKEGKALYTRDELCHLIRTALGGRAAEIIYYGDKDGISTGASGDLNQATSIAQSMICSYGMDSQFGMSTISASSLADGATLSEVRGVVNKLLEEELSNAIEIIKANRTKMDNLVAELIAKNRLNGNEIAEIINQD